VVRAGAPLSARELPALLERVHDALTERRDVLDDLNVFPVPDGDTGTNMVLTMRSSLRALQDAGPASGTERSREVIRGAIRGARGNSGVILSQVIRAVVEELMGRPRIGATTYAAALEQASKLAYEAVADPVEGTILTAIRAAADAARAAVDDGADLYEVSARTCAAVAAAVEDTPNQLEVLRDAGVVDAGARGFEVVLSAVHGHLCGEAPPVRLDEPRHVPLQRSGKGCHVSLSNPYEVQYLLDAPDDRAAPLRSALEGLGDSVVVVAAGGLLNVHVHTAAIGPAIEVGLEQGRPSNIQVVHLGEQMASRHAANHVVVAAVAVLTGPGAIELADAPHVEVVDGAAGRLPSVADLLDAIDRTAAHTVLVLPGHRNAVATARQAAEEAQRAHGREVTVIEAATTPPAVLAGLAVLDPDGDAATVAAEVAEAASAVRVGEVVAATRSAETPIGSVTRGQPLAIVGGEVVAADNGPLAALREVATHLQVDRAEIVTVLIGDDVGDDERRLSVELVQELAPDAELEVVDARQWPTRYWVGVE
jgi:uncharacterized protein